MSRISIIACIFVTLIWGLAFPVTKIVLQELTPLWATSYRYFLATLLAFLVVFLKLNYRKDFFKNYLTIGLVPGFYLGMALCLQTAGLKHTSVANSGFITTTYVLLVPLIQTFRRSEKYPIYFWFLVFFALMGTLLMSGVQDLSWQLGDLLTLLCAFFCAFQIMSVGSLTLGKKNIDPFLFNVSQSMWCFVFSVIPAFFFESIPHWTSVSQLTHQGIFYLAVISTLIAFSLQVFAQKFVPASMIGFIFLIEAPFAALCGYLFLDEKISLTQLAGGIMILLCAFLVSQIIPQKLDEKNPRHSVAPAR